jgi:mycothione reductase
MQSFDVLIVGSGSGMTIAEAALHKGLRVAVVEKDLLGGTCLNRGCIPSKMVIYPADVIQQIKHAASLGVKVTIDEIDFSSIMERMRKSVAEDRNSMEEGVKQAKDIFYYHETGEFVSDYTMKVGNENIQAKNIFLVSGARPEIPPITGLEGVDYLTYKNIWDLKKAPKSMVIAGGGYIACEMAHFFSSVGVEVTIVSRSPRLLRHADPEVSDVLTQALRSRMCVRTGVEVKKVIKATGGLKEITIADTKNEEKVIKTEALLLATGIRGNADLLNVEKTGVQADDHGYIKVNEYYETGKPRIWAFGDAIGKAMFKHVANREAELVWHSFDNNHKQTLNYDKIPYAVFSWPQVAAIGLTEEEVQRRKLKYLVGTYAYGDTAYGAAMGEEDGFVKLIVEAETYKILGCHIVGPHAALLIQEVIASMSAGEGWVYPIVDALHIHPALTEVVQRSVWRLHEPDHSHR